MTESTARDGEAAQSAALANIRVLDLSRVLAGPSCAQLLADLGADVVKIERPGRGDDSRAWGPPFMPDVKGDPTTESAYFATCNRGKRSITLDFAKPAGSEIIRQLIRTSDVLIENYKVGTLAKHGLGYAELSAINPRLVYCSITGFGQTGPYRSRPGYDTIVQAIGGLMSVTGVGGNGQAASPLKAGVAVTDLMTGLYAAVGILAALQSRHVTNRGQYIDVALLDVQVAGLANIATNYLATGKVPVPTGNRLPTLYPCDSFLCRDRHIMLIVGNDQQFRRFCSAAGLEGLANDPRFSTNALRLQHAQALAPLIEERLATDSAAAWVERFEAFGIACGPINNLAQVFDNDQVRAREMVIEMPHPVAGRMRAVANPLRLSATPVQYLRPPPTLGEHTAPILKELLGLTDSEIEHLTDNDVI